MTICMQASCVFIGWPISECAGEWTIIKDTGNYKGLSGEGTFTSEINFATSTVTGTFIGLED